jgi:uncharacterized membrane protein YuzA (DUF378 family)
MKGPSPMNYPHQFSILIVIIAGLYLGLNAIANRNFLMEVLIKVSPQSYKMIIRVIYLLFGIAALYLVAFTPSYTFLPFLDKTVLPPSLLLLSEQANTNAEVKVEAPNAVKVVYWAAQGDTNKIIDDPYKAYNAYENVGVAAVKNDVATLKLKCPTKYKVGSPKTTLPRHVHFRLVYENGVLSEVKTLNLEKQCENKNKK